MVESDKMMLAIPVQIGLNLSKLSNVTSFSANLSTDPNQVMNNVISQANTGTSGYMGFFIMLLITLVVYLTLSDKSPLGDFGFTDLRALVISLAIATIFGLVEIELGFIQNYKSVCQFAFSFMLVAIMLMIQENKE